MRQHFTPEDSQDKNILYVASVSEKLKKKVAKYQMQIYLKPSNILW